jgi:ferredoxin-NADP reductase
VTAAPARTIWSRLAYAVGLVATPLSPSHYLELVDPLLCTHERFARIEAVVDEAADARTLTLRPGRGFGAHRAGQHVEVGVTLDGRRTNRTFSLSSSPERDDGCVTITVKAGPRGRVSTHLVRDAKPGDVVALGAPAGDFVLPDDPPSKILFVTGGSGITPVMSMLRTLVARAALGDVVHVHYAPRGGDVIFRDELRRIADRHPSYRLHVIETRGAGFAPSPLMHLSPQQLEALCPGFRERDAWACGPEGLLDAVGAAFEGSPKLRTERFQAKRAPGVAGAGGDVRFVRSGRAARADGKTPLLLVAEGAGVDAPHGCRMGICHTCDATMISGCVRDLRTGRRIEEPGARVQVCVCAAEGDVDLAL